MGGVHFVCLLCGVHFVFVLTCCVCAQLEERLSIARGFVNTHAFQPRVVVDSMDDAFLHTFAAWPFRFYIIQNGKVRFVSVVRHVVVCFDRLCRCVDRECVCTCVGCAEGTAQSRVVRIRAPPDSRVA